MDDGSLQQPMHGVSVPDENSDHTAPLSIPSPERVADSCPECGGSRRYGSHRHANLDDPRW